MIAPNIYLTHYLHLRFILDSVFSIKIFLVSWTRISALALSLCLISAWCVCFVPQSFLTLYNSLDWSPPGFSVHGILQARILEWVAISFSTVSPCFSQNYLFMCFFIQWDSKFPDGRAQCFSSLHARYWALFLADLGVQHSYWNEKWKWKVLSNFVTPWTVAHQAPVSMEISRQEY